MFTIYKSIDYYYTEDSSGRRRYYERYSGDRIRERYIPEDIIDDILEESVDVDNDVDVLLRMKECYEDKIRDLTLELDEIKEKLGIDKREQEQKRERKEKKERKGKGSGSKSGNGQEYTYPFDLFETLYRMYGTTFFTYETFNHAPRNSNNRDEEILKRYNITSKKEWHLWLKSNHPDKGGDLEICQDVIIAGKAKGW